MATEARKNFRGQMEEIDYERKGMVSPRQYIKELQDSVAVPVILFLCIILEPAIYYLLFLYPCAPIE